MAKKIVFLFFLVGFVAMVQPVMAQDTAGGAGQTNQWIAIACAFGLGFASAFCGIAQSIAFRAAADAIGRNPGTADTIRGMLILGLAFIESLAIYVLLIAFMLYFKWA
ncbi:ATP synthase F0 subunit C [bacterium]|nr:ATP synthase F0 subunit C [bacterium]MCI0604170.1 ATP synthase F0 subunit C [bacterium]